ncbi:MAG: sigma-54-dependent transcriptional regulator [Thermodesulfobacteriota bacterium]
MKESILVVDDDPSIRSSLGKALRKRGYNVLEASSAEEALRTVRSSAVDVAILDVHLPGISGLEAISGLKGMDGSIVVIVITGQDSTDTALQALKAGAYDYFPKPFNFSEIEVVVGRALERRRLQRESDSLRRTIAEMARRKIVGQSDAIRGVLELAGRVAPLDTTVLITGETGTGKELVAELIHYQSSRAGGPLVKVNCAAIPETLLESELFGHEKGAFTGAHTARPGKFETANKGTIFLDEVGDIPTSVQAKLLRVLEDKNVERLGGRGAIALDVRIVAATHRDLQALMREGKLREDLYYRLSVARIHIPPLRQRLEDLPILAQHFIGELASKMGKPQAGLSPEALGELLSHHWPGNVRELAHVLERALITSSSDVITAQEIRAAIEGSYQPSAPASERTRLSLWETVQALEKSLILDALKKADGVQVEAAKLLGISSKNLWKKMRKHNLGEKKRS